MGSFGTKTSVWSPPGGGRQGPQLQGIPGSCSGPWTPGSARHMTLWLRDGPEKPLFLWPLDSWPGFPPLLVWGDVAEFWLQALKGQLLAKQISGGNG